MKVSLLITLSTTQHENDLRFDLKLQIYNRKHPLQTGIVEWLCFKDLYVGVPLYIHYYYITYYYYTIIFVYNSIYVWVKIE